jgi:hypothetical protein
MANPIAVGYYRIVEHAGHEIKAMQPSMPRTINGNGLNTGCSPNRFVPTFRQDWKAR